MSINNVFQGNLILGPAGRGNPRNSRIQINATSESGRPLLELAGLDGETGAMLDATGLVIAKGSGKGIRVDVDSPTFGWADLIGTVHTRTTGNAQPAQAAYQGGIYQFSFGTAGGVTEVVNEFHMPHDYVPGTDMFIHAHWSTIAAPTGNVNWLFEAAYAKGYSGGAFEGTPAASAATNVTQVTAASVAAFKHEISEVHFSAPGGLINLPNTVSITASAGTLTSATDCFTAGDIGRTIRIAGAGTAGAVHDTTISAFATTKSVTVANNAVTTVTSVAGALSYRVMNTGLLETDGLILVRTYRDSARAGGPLDVAPFLHCVDIHYQTNGMIGTKTRNTPFYT